MRILIRLVAGFFPFVILASTALAELPNRPNILWITAEDMSPTLGCYGDAYARTPNIDVLCEQSVRYTNAFATTPVCSPARSCLINGCIATTLGTHNMRSTFPIPAEMKGFPALLRDAQYYTTNNVKTDYNTSNAGQIISASWDDSSHTAHWRGRRKEQPFFSVFNLMTSHQSRSMVWSYERFRNEVQSRLSAREIHDPDQAPVPPYYPDTVVIRRTLARYYDCVTAMDKEVGVILGQLADAGLADETIVFFYSDHGSGLPRHKRALLDSGMRVPLLIRFPSKYRHLAPGEPGSTVDRLVSFEDFAPTVLSLVGISTVPAYMRGRAFLGPRTRSRRRYVYGHRDRVDEVVDLARSVRDERYLYIRNYLPHLGYNQPSAWPDDSAIRHEFYRLADEEKMTPPQWHFVAPTRPREELYDCRADPQNLVNLAGSADHRQVLQRMRTAHCQGLMDSRDLGFLPETEQWKVASRETPYEWSQHGDEYALETLIEAASLVGTPSFAKFGANLASSHPTIRYWGAVGYAAAKSLPNDAVGLLTEALADDVQIVRIAAADALARHGHVRAALPVLTGLLKHQDRTVVLYAARTIELLGGKARTAHAEMKTLSERFQDEPGDLAWFIRFTTTGYLNRVKPVPVVLCQSLILR